MTHRIGFCSLLLATLSIVGALALGQVNPFRGTPLDDQRNDPSMGVYVRDSANALDKMTLAQRQERSGEWGKAADLYQEVLEKLNDRVVPAPDEPAAPTVVRYVSVTQAVQERLSKWPAQGLDVYRGRYEPLAASALAAASSAPEGEVAALTKIISLYSATDAAKSAAIRLMDHYFEAGDFNAAAWLGDRLLAIHPNLVTERAAVLYRNEPV